MIIFEFENMMRSFIISLQIKHFLNEQIENVELFNFQICIQLFWIYYMYRNLLISINKENQKKSLNSTILVWWSFHTKTKIVFKITLITQP